MPTRYSHTNIVARNPERLAEFYSNVLDCPRVAERRLQGSWLSRAMGLPDARLHVFHVRLPGCGDGDMPTIEIFGMDDLGDAGPGAPNRPGLMHTAFVVDDVHASLDRLLAAGGEKLGEIDGTTVEGVGAVLFVYARDPEGNIVELQQFE
jgi:catechol 2,3-dioxygenase-like lactoylglutathione lyase family enzyme